MLVFSLWHTIKPLFCLSIMLLLRDPLYHAMQQQEEQKALYSLFVILDEVKITPTWHIYRGSHSITQASASRSSQQQVITDSNQIGWSNDCPWTTVNPHTVTKSCLVLVFKCISLRCASDVGGWQPPVAESMRFESCVSFFFCTPW